MNFKTMLTVDPGIHTGWAYFKDDSTTIPEIGQFDCGNIKIYKTLAMENKILKLKNNFKNILLLYPLSIILIESVEIYQGSLKSMTSAVRGNLTLLSMLIGAYIAIADEVGIPCQLVSPRWKGQLNYKALAVWVKNINGCTYPSEHILAAVGIGLNAKGLL